jgi:hypothetical protein
MSGFAKLEKRDGITDTTLNTPISSPISRKG